MVWEGGKALFAIPAYKLPHVHEILGDFLREGAGGERWAWIMAQNAGYTALESLVGFFLGGSAGLARTPRSPGTGPASCPRRGASAALRRARRPAARDADDARTAALALSAG